MTDFARAGIRSMLWLFMLPWAVQAAANDPGLTRLQAYIASLDTLTAEFRQQVIDRDLEVVESASGELALRKPGHFRWDYQVPFERVIVADGERVWLYEADLEQVTVRRLDAGLGETPAALLTGSADVLERFEFLGSDSDGELLWVRLGPRSTDADFESIRLAFRGTELAQLELRDRLGQTTQLEFSDLRRGMPLADELFHFDAPAGVDVIDEDEL